MVWARWRVMATHARRHRPAESVFKTGIRDVAIVDIGGKRIVLHSPHHPAPTRNSAIIIRFGCTARGRHESNDSRVMFLCVTTADTFDRPLRSMESDTKVFREFARRQRNKKKTVVFRQFFRSICLSIADTMRFDRSVRFTLLNDSILRIWNFKSV